MKKIYITNDRVRAEFQPEWGGLFSALQFHHPDKGWVDAFVTEAQKPAAVRKTPYFGCFLMVPFANRMADGLIKTENAAFKFPIVQEAQNLAIHGTGWDKPWQVIDQTQTTLVMKHEWASDDGRFHFQVHLSTALRGAEIELDLTLQNMADHALPLGLGFHPWFSDIHQSKVWFGAELPVNRESPWSVYPSHDFEALPEIFTPAAYDTLDASFDDWSQKVGIDLHDKGLSLEMTASGALDRIHVFVKGENNRFCLEPVSHKPGDLRDPDFLVAPGEAVSGQMKLVCSAI